MSRNGRYDKSQLRYIVKVIIIFELCYHFNKSNINNSQLIK